MAKGRRSYGWRPSAPDHRDHYYQTPRHIRKALAPTVDLTAVKMPWPWLPVLNQGGLGSCGPSSAAEALIYSAFRMERLPAVASPSILYIYYAARMIQGTVAQDSGVDNRSLMKALSTYGWCDRRLWPYVESQLTIKPALNCFAQGQNRKIQEYLAVPQTLEEMKGSLQNNDPFIFGFTVYESFESDTAAKTGVITYPAPNESVLGGHDVSFFGFTDVDRPGVLPQNKWPANTFKFRNHWYNEDGTPWGDGGYGYMPYAYGTNANLAGDFWALLTAGLPRR